MSRAVGAVAVVVLAAGALSGCMEVGGSAPNAPGAPQPAGRPSLGHVQTGLMQTRDDARRHGEVPPTASSGPSVKADGSSDDLAGGKPSATRSAGRPGAGATGAAGGSTGSVGGGAKSGGTGGSSGGGTGGSPSATASAPATLPAAPPTLPPTGPTTSSSPSVSASAAPTP